MHIVTPARPRSPRPYASQQHLAPTSGFENMAHEEHRLSVYDEFTASMPEKRLLREILALTLGTTNAAELDDPGAILLGELAVPLFETSGLPLLVLGEIWNVADELCGGFLTRDGVALCLRMMGWAQRDMEAGKPFASDVGDVVRLDWLRPDGPMPTLDILSDGPAPQRRPAQFLPSKNPQPKQAPPASPHYEPPSGPPPVARVAQSSAGPPISPVQPNRPTPSSLGSAAFARAHRPSGSTSSVGSSSADPPYYPSSNIVAQPANSVTSIVDDLSGLMFAPLTPDSKPKNSEAVASSSLGLPPSGSSRFSMISAVIGEKGKGKETVPTSSTADPFADPNAEPTASSDPLGVVSGPPIVPTKPQTSRSSSTEDEDMQAAKIKFPDLRLTPSPGPVSLPPVEPKSSVAENQLELRYPAVPSRSPSTSPSVALSTSSPPRSPPRPPVPAAEPEPDSTLPPLSMIQKAKYLKLWMATGGKENPVENEGLDGEACRGVFIKSRLGFGILGRIWDLATSGAPDEAEMHLHEFMLAMYLIEGLMSKKIQISDLPKRLPASLIDSARENGRQSSSVPSISLQLPTLHTTPSVSPSPSPLSPAVTVTPPVAPNGLVASPFLDPGATSTRRPPRRSAPRLPTLEERAARAFVRLDLVETGEVSGAMLLPFFMGSGLDVSVLADIWDKADANTDGSLTLEEFTHAYKLILDQVPGFDAVSAAPIEPEAGPQLISWDGSPIATRHSIYAAPDSLLDQEQEEQQQFNRLQRRPAPSLPIDRPISRLEERPLPPTPGESSSPTTSRTRRNMDLPAPPLPSRETTIALTLTVPERPSPSDEVDELPPLPVSPPPRSPSGHRRATSTSPALASSGSSSPSARHHRSQSARTTPSSPISRSEASSPAHLRRATTSTGSGRLSAPTPEVDVRRSMHEALETVLPPDSVADHEPPPAYTPSLGAGERAMDIPA